MFAEKLLVALDVDTGERARTLVSELKEMVGGFKVGSRLFTLEGPSLVHAIAATGARVFVDLKFHDIPHTVATAVESAVQTGAWMINVHASGGVPMMRAAVAAGRDAAARAGRPAPLLIAVTVLTSMDEDTLRAIGVQRPLMDQVVTLARMTQDAGLDGVVASPLEIQAIRAACGPDFAIVTPGIRRPGVGERDDQHRTMGPADAVRAGASYLVVGRPIIAAANPRAAAEDIVNEIGSGARPTLR
jgi:orotidine-5'-phosphate decarboxylase